MSYRIFAMRNYDYYILCYFEPACFYLGLAIVEEEFDWTVPKPKSLSVWELQWTCWTEEQGI